MNLARTALNVCFPLFLGVLALSGAKPASPSFLPGDGGTCSGGPGGDFDWVVTAGQTVLFDTRRTLIVGGPGGVPTAVEEALEGLVEVRNLRIEAGGQIRASGPNPLRICATGTVEIRGTLDVSGFRAKDVATLNTGNIVEPGAVGGPGGGRGGDANSVTTSSTSAGSNGSGPFEGVRGGRGGESGFAPANLGKDARRPGGGGGGRFAADQGALVAENGFDGHPLSTGAITGLKPARGGPAGTGPFVDSDPTNDFFGFKPILGTSGELVGLVRGELTHLGAGAGGGGGGNAIPASTFPNPNYNFGSDEKGGPGGGGGGALQIRAAGAIVFGSQGVILSNGGKGATGENTYFLDHIGGSGGSGSGGHVVLESATAIDFTDGDPVSAPLRDYVQALGGPRVTGILGPNNAPAGISHGGAGGPGVIQLHVPLAHFTIAADPSAGIVIPLAAVSEPDPLGALAHPTPIPLLAAGDSAQR